MSVGELWVQSLIFPWLLIILAFWVGSSTILMWRMWYRIVALKRHNALLQELMMGGVSGLRGQITDLQENKADKGGRRSKPRQRRSKESYAGQLRPERGRIPTEAREPEDSTEIREDSNLEVPPAVEIQTIEGTERRDETTAKVN